MYFGSGCGDIGPGTDLLRHGASPVSMRSCRISLGVSERPRIARASDCISTTALVTIGVAELVPLSVRVSLVEIVAVLPERMAEKKGTHG